MAPGKRSDSMFIGVQVWVQTWNAKHKVGEADLRASLLLLFLVLVLLARPGLIGHGIALCLPSRAVVHA